MCKSMTYALTTASIFLVTGCDDDDGGAESESESEAESEGVSGNPLGIDNTALPFPSSYYLEADDSTPTGWRLALIEDDLPVVTFQEITTDPAPWNRADGFSPAAPILVHFEPRLDGASLPPIDDPGQSLAAGSPTVIVDLETGARVPHFAELDLTATADDRQALILRPLQRLATAHAYAVGVTRELQTLDGDPVAPTPGFQSILDGSAGDPRLDRIRGRYPDIFAALEGAGVAKGDLALAFDFVTASEEFLTQDILAMRAQVLEAIGEQGENLGYTIDAIVEDDHDSTLRVITGTYGVPVFLSGGEENYDSYGALVRGDDGLPVAQRTMQANFTMVIPKIAEDAARRPMPLLQYGHGLMGSSEESKAGWLRELANTYGYVVVAHDWMGVAEPDVPAVVRALGNANDSEILFDRTKQGTVNAIALTRVARWQLSQDEAASVDGEPVIDTSQVYYYGNSQGGIWGTTLCAYSPELQKCVLGVGAANYSTMLQRSVDWPGYGIVQYGAYPERMTDLILITLMQMMWDPTDAVTASSHLMSDPFPDTPLRPVLMQCGIADSQVPNVATDYQARTMGIPYLAPAVRDIYGVTPREGPLDSALTYWDYGLDPIKTNNVMGDDNEVHEAVRRSPAAQRQLAMFLTPGGQVEQTCTGADGGCWCESVADYAAACE